MEIQRTYNSQEDLKGEKSEDLQYPDFQTSYKATVIKTVTVVTKIDK